MSKKIITRIKKILQKEKDYTISYGKWRGKDVSKEVAEIKEALAYVRELEKGEKK